MKCDVVIYDPGFGPHGTDWRRLYSLADKRTAMHCAELAFKRDGVPLMVMTAPKTRIGRMVAKFGRTPQDVA